MNRDTTVRDVKRGTRTVTPDGEGVTIGMNMRKNTNGGPGVRQLVVKLDDGRVRHYSVSDLVFFAEVSGPNPVKT